ncbi:endospore germination permease [Sulfoacidibacillus thermotolerans]|uniref:Uncharacterized protein n=1 Tax=Sulfoacidibacillus thermotolerans TaxID=1765684 RepID=A0A2U3D899_SULT2|nr:endospore germination permease [Sulfoacidibacillus thermotolerans]PWI57491.1 hypothetical protein BM613_08440 [Sulfoacidibacillus thermotolerans]
MPLEKASRWESFFATMITLPIIGHAVLVSLLVRTVGRDEWLAVLITTPLAAALVYAIWRVRKEDPQATFPALAKKLLGRPLGFVLTLVLALYLLFLSMSSIAFLVDFIQISFFPETPTFALVLFFALFCLYAIFKGTKVILQTAIVLGISSLFTGSTVTMMSSPMKDFGEWLPFLEFGLKPVGLGVWVVLSMWAELLFLLTLPFEDTNPPVYLKLWIISIAINAFMTITPTMGVISLFGLGFASMLTYPTEETTRIIHLFIVDRFDIYGLMLMTFGTYIRTTLYFRLGFDLLFPPKQKQVRSTFLRIVMALLFALLAGIAYLIAKQHVRVEQILLLYTLCGALILLPFLLLVILWIKNKLAARQIALKTS